MAKMYAVKEGRMYVMRQTRFRHLRAQGKEHPHDVCAVARSVKELREMAATYNLWPDADYSAVEETNG